MIQVLRWPLPIALIGLLALVTGCGDDDNRNNLVDPLLGNAEAAPNFWLSDTNPSSITYGKPVSPRDFLAEVSAWYFGLAT